MYEIPIESFEVGASTKPRIASGLLQLVEYQSIISGRVDGALDGTRESVTAYAYSLIEEIIETTRELNIKHWKQQTPPNVDRVVEEWADVMAFLGIMTINLAKACDLDPNEFADRVAEQYQKTSENNMRRFENGREQV